MTEQANPRPVRGHNFTNEYVDGRFDTTCACGWESTGHETFREAITAESAHLASVGPSRSLLAGNRKQRDLGWVVVCECGYKVEGLGSGEIKRFVDYHDDDEHKTISYLESRLPTADFGDVQDHVTGV